MDITRKQQGDIAEDLKKKMVFLTGPRQVGKTTLAKKLMQRYTNPLYLNYDVYESKQIIKNRSWNRDVDLLIFDELHKMKGWKNYLKGIFDDRPESLHILVTGSARLEVFKKAGDSLAGRYFAHHLFPITSRDMTSIPLKMLLKRGGFPEPLLSKTDIDADRWRKQYVESLLREDIQDIAKIFDVKAIQEIFERLRRSVGSTISYLNISQDIGISPTTVKKYIEILESLYIVFQIKPYSTKISRSILKEPKIYFYDTGLVVGDEGAILENQTAVSLLSYITYQNDTLGTRHVLHYLKNKEKKEVDFAVSDGQQVLHMYEVKVSDTAVSPALIYFAERYKFKGTQLVEHIRHEFTHKDSGLEVREIEKYLKKLS
jgi:predicted AAA+ superfamily ATPase